LNPSSSGELMSSISDHDRIAATTTNLYPQQYYLHSTNGSAPANEEDPFKAIIPPEFPEMSGICTNMNNNNHSSYHHSGQQQHSRSLAISLIEDHQVPDLRMISMRSPLSASLEQYDHHHHHQGTHMGYNSTSSTGRPSSTSLKIVVTPSPLNASSSDHVQPYTSTIHNNNNGQSEHQYYQLYETQQQQLPFPILIDQEVEQDDENVRETQPQKNPLQLGLESVAAFFGMQLDEGEIGYSSNTSNHNEYQYAQPRSRVDGIMVSPKVTTIVDSTSLTKDTSTPVVLPKTFPIKMSTLQNDRRTPTGTATTTMTPSRPIPLPGSSSSRHQHQHRQSFHEANYHRRHSAPIDMTLSGSDNSTTTTTTAATPESLLGSNSSRVSPHINNYAANANPNAIVTHGKFNANGIPQDFYDLKDGHLWRAKYCVLENGILYFYRNATDGESIEASLERKRSSVQQNCGGHKGGSDPSPSDHSSFVAATLQHGGSAAAATYTTSTSTVTGTTTTRPSAAVDASISRRRSSAQDLSKSPMPVPILLHHLDSTESSDTGSSMWEKRVFMDCVGGVRTAEQQYGPNSFELIALNDDDDFDQRHNIDTLVLRASDQPEMKEWIFQFHRSLASFVRNIMDVFGSTSTTGAFLDIHHPPSMQSARFGTTEHRHHNISTTSSRLLNSSGGDRDGIPLSPSEKQLQTLLYAVSPRFHHSHHSGSATHNHHQVPPPHTLSHGHGRTTLKRRIVDARKPITDTGANDVGTTTTVSLLSSPLPDLDDNITDDTTQQQQLFGLYEQPQSPTENNTSLSPSLKVVVSSSHQQRFLIPPPGSKGSNRSPVMGTTTYTPTSQIGTDGRKTRDSTSPKSDSLQNDDESNKPENIIVLPKQPSITTTGKYIPPHLRNNNKSIDPSPPKSKYVPPHLRRQLEQTGIGSNQTGDKVRHGDIAVVASNGFLTATRGSGDRVDYAPLSSGRNGEIAAPCTPPRDGISSSSFGLNGDRHHGTVAPTIIDHLDVVGTTTLNFVRGGCADPRLIQGSIMDRNYIPKRTSRVGQVASQPFGSYGGGHSCRPPKATGSSTVEASSASTTTTTTESLSSSPILPSLRWEAGAVSECGVREYNEDAYLITNDLLLAYKEDQSQQQQIRWKQEDMDHSLGVFAVFDGHLGNEAARFAVENLANFIREQLLVKVGNYSADDDGMSEHQHNSLLGDDNNDDHCQSPLSPSNVENVLREAMIKMDDRFCQLCQEDGREWESGATALVAMIVNEHLVIANLGDCRGVLCRFVTDTDSYETDVSWSELTTIAEDQLSSERTSAYDGTAHTIATHRCFWKEVTTVHTPSAEKERLRIEEANGWIRTDIEIPMAQLRRMDFSDEDVIRILQRCFNYFESSNNNTHDTITPSTEGGERSVKECKAAPQRILDISRVCGELAVSRALGDRDFKAAFNTLSTNDMRADDCPAMDEEGWWDSPLFLPYPDNHSRRFKGDLVSNTPDFQRIKIGDVGVSGEFLLLACDGLWDVMDYDDAVRVARDLLFRKKWTAKKSAVRLAELAMHLGSSDNVTVVLIRLFSSSTPDGR
jgi:serine/threonine protein phosphatase PrpC